MDHFLICRADDQLVAAVSWSGMSVVGRTASGLPLLEAAEEAALVLTLPPQHLAEQSSPPGTPAPAEPPSRPGGEPVPVWNAAHAGPSRLAFTLTAGTRLAPSADGILALLADRTLRPSTDPAGPHDTAIELPWRLALCPFAADGHVAVARHPAKPIAGGGVTGMWRTRIVARRPNGAELAASGLRLVAVGEALAESPDPPWAAPPRGIPLHRDARRRVHREAAQEPARSDRLELSSLGGTLSASGPWPAFRWEHRAVLGRDMQVRTIANGVLFPLGHRAVYSEFTERMVDPAAGDAAVLRSTFVLTVDDAVRPAPASVRARRAFPFDRAVLERTTYTDLKRAGWIDFPVPGGGPEPTYFWPAPADGSDEHLTFPVRLEAVGDAVTVRIPLIFVADLSPTFASVSDPGLASVLASAYGEVAAAVPGVSLDLVRSAAPREGDRHEVQGLSLGGTPVEGGYWPRLRTVTLALPALRALLGRDTAPVFRYADRYLDVGDVEAVVLETTERIDVGFGAHAERSGGLVVPSFTANALSRLHGPVNMQALPDADGRVDPLKLFPEAASLLGFSLRDLLPNPIPQPRILAVLPAAADATPEVRVVWKDVPLKTRLPFEAGGGGKLTLTSTTSRAATETTCTLADVGLLFPPGRPQLRLRFETIGFTQIGSAPPRLELNGVSAEFLNELQLLQELGDAVGLAGAGPAIHASPTEVSARYRLPVAPVTAGAFVLRNIVFSAGIRVPLDGRAPSVSLAFARREEPFALTVLMFGGGGYLEVDLDHRGLQRVEAALEFGALVAMDFVVARAELHALGGVRFVLAPDGSISIGGYLRIGGCVDVLGLVSVSVELCVELRYRSETKALVGRATLVIDIDLTLWSESVELDSGEWVLTGGPARAPLITPPPGVPFERVITPAVTAAEAEVFADAVESDAAALARWQAYRAAFARPPGSPA